MSDTLYTKQFNEGTSYEDILAEWDDAVIVHSTEPGDIRFGGFKPNSGSLSENTTFSAQ